MEKLFFAQTVDIKRSAKSENHGLLMNFQKVLIRLLVLILKNNLRQHSFFRVISIFRIYW